MQNIAIQYCLCLTFLLEINSLFCDIKMFSTNSAVNVLLRAQCGLCYYCIVIELSLRYCWLMFLKLKCLENRRNKSYSSKSLMHLSATVVSWLLDELLTAVFYFFSIFSCLKTSLDLGYQLLFILLWLTEVVFSTFILENIGVFKY